VPSHVLILGCGRSGTSIFGELFEHLPGYTYYSEPDFAQVVDTCYASLAAVKVPRESKAHPVTPGLSFPMTSMLAVMPMPRELYWQVRHPLDAIASLRPGIANNWGHHPRPPDWRVWLERPLVERCAHHWAYINSVGYRQIRHLTKVCRFETMLADPFGFARSICRQVGIDPARCESAIAGWADRVQDVNNERFVEAKTSRPYSRADHARRIGRWKENLTKDDVQKVLPIIRDAATLLDYPLADHSTA